MNILITEGIGANYWIRRGWANAFHALGHKVYMWQTDKVPAFDVFKQLDPIDVFIGTTWLLDRATVKNLNSRPDIKVILSANNWGPDDYKKSPEFPIDYASPKELEEFSNLRIGRVVITAQYNQKYIQDTHGRWQEEFHSNLLGLMLSADVTEFYPVLPEEKLRCDIAFIGGYWPYKAKYLQQYITKFLYPNTTLKTKIFGDGWSGVQNYGKAPLGLDKSLYCSALVCPNVFEPHSLEWGYDLNSRAYQISACGGFQITQKVKSLYEDVFNMGALVFVDTPEEYLDKVLFYRDHPQLRLPLIKEAMNIVWNHHTNFHRVGEIFIALGLDKEAKDAYAQTAKNYASMQSKQKEFFQKIEEFLQ